MPVVITIPAKNENKNIKKKRNKNKLKKKINRIQTDTSSKLVNAFQTIKPVADMNIKMKHLFRYDNHSV